MAQIRLPPYRSVALRAVLALLVGAALFVAGRAVWTERHIRHEDAVGMPPLTAPSHPAPSAKVAPGPVKPSFDVVRVDPSGNAVLAGRAAPGAEVVVRQGNKEIGRTRADSHGDWVLLPPAPLAPGARELTLSEQMPKGNPVQGDRSVLLVVPPRSQPAQQLSGKGATQSGALAVLTEGAKPPRVLQGPAAGAHRLQLGTVDYGNSGQVRFSGSAVPGSTVRVYVDKHPVGDARADAAGNWTLVPNGHLAPGNHELRLDQLSGQGQVTARVELPFTRAQLTAQQVAPGSIVVQPGQNLWLIARHRYGQGIRYLVIYAANRGQIRDPNLIYPGQVFTIPESATPKGPMPSSSSTSR